MNALRVPGLNPFLYGLMDVYAFFLMFLDKLLRHFDPQLFCYKARNTGKPLSFIPVFVPGRVKFDALRKY
jgi:hypothetical protein